MFFQVSPHLTSTKELEHFLSHIDTEKVGFLGIDTEFMRRTTYWPKLCLVQLSTPYAACTLDVLSSDMTLDPLRTFLSDKTLPKIFHSAQQDIDCLEKLLGNTLEPIFDIQIASMCLSPAFMPSYQMLVHEHIGPTLEKKHQTINWTKRPLPKKALEYALNDTRYLGDLYNLFQERLKQKNRLCWMNEDMQNFRKTKATSPWKKVRGWHQISYTQSSFKHLMQVALWREDQAKIQDRPRQKIIKDEHILKLVKCKDTKTFDNLVKELLGEGTWPLIETTSSQNDPNQWTLPTLASLSTQEKKDVQTLKEKAQNVADTHDLPLAFLVTKKEMETYIQKKRVSKRLLGWRQTLLEWT